MSSLWQENMVVHLTLDMQFCSLLGTGNVRDQWKLLCYHPSNIHHQHQSRTTSFSRLALLIYITLEQIRQLPVLGNRTINNW